MQPLVLIVIGSDSDLHVIQSAVKVFEDFEVQYQIRISSAHRLPHKTAQLALEAEQKGVEVIIAAAGLAAHLPGVIAAFTTLPVIGVPIKSGALNGQDALYAIVQMPPGIPVATVAIDGAKNAAILACQILGIKYPDIRAKLKNYKLELAAEVEAKDKKLQEKGVYGYLAT